MTGAEIAIGAFTLCNSVRVFAYFPQMVRIGRDTHGAVAISYSTWGLFGASHLSTVAYAVLAVQDWKMATVFLANTVCCVIILAMTVIKRRRYQDAQRKVREEGTAQFEMVQSSKPAAGGAHLRLIVNPTFGRAKPHLALMDEWRRSQKAS